MANIFQATQARQDRRDAFVQDKKDEIAALKEVANEGITQVGGNPEKLGAFLNMMVMVPSYSSRNAMLVMQQRPDATHLETSKGWYDVGRFLTGDEKENGVKILVAKQKGRKTYFDPQTVYDISQTTGKPVKKPVTVLAEDTPGMQKAFNGLVESSPVPVMPDEQLDVPALYDAGERTIWVNNAFSDHETFAAVVNANAHAILHQEDIKVNGRDMGYDPEMSEFLTSCITYVVCHRYGVPFDSIDLEHSAARLGSMDFDTMRDMVYKIGDAAKINCDRINREFNPPTQARGKQPPKQER
ncbi:hypothetical protein LJC60_06705 [Ruminococcaceae bacterium OttesenSCG-928-D13]|nr:hypothetical protein [Ruminococcaceae bacterium OttesenSCG-928-D13]